MITINEAKNLGAKFIPFPLTKELDKLLPGTDTSIVQWPNGNYEVVSCPLGELTGPKGEKGEL